MSSKNLNYCRAKNLSRSSIYVNQYSEIVVYDNCKFEIIIKNNWWGMGTFYEIKIKFI